jgi:hypothetical protein
MVLIHAQAAIVHELGGARKNILNNFMCIKFCSVIYAMPSSSSELSPATMSPSARRTIAAQRERLQQLNLLDFDGRAWTTNCHQDQVTLFARNEAAARTPRQVGRVSRLMSDKHKLKPMKHKINY